MKEEKINKMYEAFISRKSKQKENQMTLEAKSKCLQCTGKCTFCPLDEMK